MRFILFFCAFAIGCRTQPLELAPADLAAPPLRCNGFNQCINQCNSADCQRQCLARVAPDAHDLYLQAVGCGYQFCLDAQPPRPPRCMQSGDGFIDAPAAAAGDCDRCLTDVRTTLSMTACVVPSGADCAPAACDPLVQRCLRDSR